MTAEKLQQANELRDKIVEFNQMVKRAENQKTERIVFSSGNGYDSVCVCVDEGIIGLVRRIIIAETNAKIKALEEEFLAL